MIKSKDKYQDRIPTAEERQREQTKGAILAPFIVYGVCMLIAMLAFPSPENRTIGYLTIFAIAGSLFFFPSFYMLIKDREHIKMRAYLLFMGALGISPLVAYLIG